MSNKQKRLNVKINKPMVFFDFYLITEIKRKIKVRKKTQGTYGFLIK